MMFACVEFNKTRSSSVSGSTYKNFDDLGEKIFLKIPSALRVGNLPCYRYSEIPEETVQVTHFCCSGIVNCVNKQTD